MSRISKQAAALAPAAYMHDITAVGALRASDASRLLPEARWTEGYHKGRPALFGLLARAQDDRDAVLRTLGKAGLDARIVVYRQHREGK